MCKTCHSKVFKRNVPCQAVYSNLCLDEISPELFVLLKLERILIAQIIGFERNSCNKGPENENQRCDL